MSNTTHSLTDVKIIIETTYSDYLRMIKLIERDEKNRKRNRERSSSKSSSSGSSPPKARTPPIRLNVKSPPIPAGIISPENLKPGLVNPPFQPNPTSQPNLQPNQVSKNSSRSSADISL